MTEEHDTAYLPSAFMVLWALSLGLDATHFFGGFSDAPRLATIALVLFALWRPSAIAMALTLVIAPVEWIAQTPVTSNHGFVVALASLTALATGAWRDRRDPRQTTRARPVLTTLAAAVYGAAILQKLNWEYLTDTDASCAVALWRQYFPIPDALAVFFGPGSLVVEALLALAIVHPRLHRPGLFLAFGFHLILGVNPFSPIFLFSITMLAFFSLLLPQDASDDLLPTARRVALLMLLALAARAADLFPLQLAIAWLAWVALQPALLLRILEVETVPASTWDRPAKLMASVVCVVAVLNCVPAYTGDRQFNSFDMYSNLKVDHTGSNHLFLPGLFDTPRPFAEPVTILSHEPDFPNDAVVLGIGVPRLEFVRWLQTSPDLQVVRWRDAQGDEHVWRRGDPLPGGVTPTDLAWRRLRRVSDPPRCVDCPSCLLAEHYADNPPSPGD